MINFNRAERSFQHENNRNSLDGFEMPSLTRIRFYGWNIYGGHWSNFTINFWTISQRLWRNLHRTEFFWIIKWISEMSRVNRIRRTIVVQRTLPNWPVKGVRIWSALYVSSFNCSILGLSKHVYSNNWKKRCENWLSVFACFSFSRRNFILNFSQLLSILAPWQRFSNDDL